MKLNDNQINIFEGRIAATYLVSETSCDVEVYIKIVACGDFIIEPVFCTTKTLDSPLSNPGIYLRRITHNEDGDVMLAIQPREYSEIDITIESFTVEGTTSSPTDYDSLPSDDYTESSINESYYSTFSYPILADSEISYLMINIEQSGLSSNGGLVSS